jgi:hypothetical protein
MRAVDSLPSFLVAKAQQIRRFRTVGRQTGSYPETGFEDVGRIGSRNSASRKSSCFPNGGAPSGKIMGAAATSAEEMRRETHANSCSPFARPPEKVSGDRFVTDSKYYIVLPTFVRPEGAPFGRPWERDGSLRSPQLWPNGNTIAPVLSANRSVSFSYHPALFTLVHTCASMLVSCPAHLVILAPIKNRVDGIESTQIVGVHRGCAQRHQRAVNLDPSRPGLAHPVKHLLR